ncbi:MAG: hypothetical protein MJ252_23135 [archaeon]|nr:hypothetical protein [archaeon]
MVKLGIKVMISVDLINMGFAFGNVFLWYLGLNPENFIIKEKVNEFKDYKNIFIPMIIVIFLFTWLFFQKKATNYGHRAIFLFEKLFALLLTYYSFSILLKIYLLVPKNLMIKILLLCLIINCFLLLVSLLMDLCIRQKEVSGKVTEKILERERGISQYSALYRDSTADNIPKN